MYSVNVQRKCGDGKRRQCAVGGKKKLKIINNELIKDDLNRNLTNVRNIKIIVAPRVEISLSCLEDFNLRSAKIFYEYLGRNRLPSTSLYSSPCLPGAGLWFLRPYR